MQPYDVSISQVPDQQKRVFNLRINGEFGPDLSVEDAKELIEDLKEMVELYEELAEEDA